MFDFIIVAGMALLPVPAYAATVVQTETLEQQINRVAIEYQIATSTLYNLVQSESRGDPNAIGDNGCSLGLVQIYFCGKEALPNPFDFDRKPITKEQALDPDFVLRVAAYYISIGEEYHWSPCSCSKTLRNRIGNVPRQHAKDFVPNASMLNGKALILRYGNVSHVAEKVEIKNEGILVFEGNFEGCKTGYRLITWEELERTLVGFWSDSP